MTKDRLKEIHNIGRNEGQADRRMVELSKTEAILELIAEVRRLQNEVDHKQLHNKNQLEILADRKKELERTQGELLGKSMALGDLRKENQQLRAKRETLRERLATLEQLLREASHHVVIVDDPKGLYMRIDEALASKQPLADAVLGEKK